MSQELLLPGIVVRDNNAQRTCCALVLDASNSMGWTLPGGARPIDELNRGLRVLEHELGRNAAVRTQVEVLIIRVGEVAQVVCDWVAAGDFVAPTLVSDGATPLGAGMDLALEEVEVRKQWFRDEGIPYTRPWIFMISDGEPTDAGWEYAAERCVRAEQGKHILVFPIAVSGGNVDKLGRFSNQCVKVLDALKFEELFRFVSDSVGIATGSVPGQRLQLPADNWSLQT